MGRVMGRVMEVSVWLGLVLVLQMLPLVSADNVDCPACPAKGSDTSAIDIAKKMYVDANKTCNDLHPWNNAVCLQPIPFYFQVAKATREGSLQLLQEAYAELLKARGMGRGRVLMDEEAEPCNEKVTQVVVGLMQLAVNTEKLFPKVAEVLICAKALKPSPHTSQKTPLCNGSPAPKDHTSYLRQLIYSLRLVLDALVLYHESHE